MLEPQNVQVFFSYGPEKSNIFQTTAICCQYYMHHEHFTEASQQSMTWEILFNRHKIQIPAPLVICLSDIISDEVPVYQLRI